MTIIKVCVKSNRIWNKKITLFSHFDMIKVNKTKVYSLECCCFPVTSFLPPCQTEVFDTQEFWGDQTATSWLVSSLLWGHGVGSSLLELRSLLMGREDVDWAEFSSVCENQPPDVGCGTCPDFSWGREAHKWRHWCCGEVGCG